MTLAPLPYFLIDAFTCQPLTGNPAAVVRFPEGPWPADARLQALAREFNVSQTACVQSQGPGSLAIRWLSPQREVPLCGHASLAACRAADQWGLWPQEGPLSLVTAQRGKLRCQKSRNQYTLRFDAMPSAPTRMPDRVQRGLGVSRAPIAAHHSSMLLLLELESAEQVTSARPNSRTLGHWHRHGVALTAADSNGYDFVTRMFAPRFGIDEDPACGSAHTVIGPYWAKKLGKTKLLARQGSERGGQIHIDYDPMNKVQQIDLTGQTAITMQGELSPELSVLLQGGGCFSSA